MWKSRLGGYDLGKDVLGIRGRIYSLQPDSDVNLSATPTDLGVGENRKANDTTKKGQKK